MINTDFVWNISGAKTPGDGRAVAPKKILKFNIKKQGEKDKIIATKLQNKT